MVQGLRHTLSSKLQWQLRAGRVCLVAAMCAVSLSGALCGAFPWSSCLGKPEAAYAETRVDTTDLEAALDGREITITTNEFSMSNLVDEGLSSLSLDDLKKAVTDLTAERDAMSANQEDLAQRIEENQAHLSDIDARLPEEEALAERAVRERYKIQQHRGDLFEAVLSSYTLNDFFDTIEYIKAASKVSVDQVVSLRAERVACVAEGEQLVEEKTNVDARLEQANALIEKVTAARDEAQRKVDMVNNAKLVEDGIKWDVGEDAFVAEWAPRIDRFLAGSPMQGLGEAFAKAAWANNIDPRFSPAISTIESSNGRYCIKPHNAWGWGAADSDPYGLASSWATWEDAINAHVRGLARGYGYTISVEGAKKYCPPNWEKWYATTVAEMNKI